MEVLQDGASYCPGGVEVVREALLLRRELPDSLVFALDDAPTAEPETHRKLVEFSAHKKLATQKEVRPFRLFLSMEDSGEWVVSPVVTPEEISVRTGVFRVGGVGDSQRLSLLLARQCPVEVYRSLREENWAFCETIDFLRFSPWAAESIREHGNTADFVKRGVKMAGRESDLRFICLPCIPFDDVRAKDLREAFGSRTPTHIAATIAAMCRSRSFAEETSLDGSSFDVAHLFAAATSGLRLEKLVKLHPELAGLAACHPNGADIPLSAVLAEHRDIVEEVRPTVLGGRVGGGSEAARPPLVI